MPSRSSTTSKRNSTKPNMPSEPRKMAKQKPVVAVTKDSQPKDILHASWEFLSVYVFFHIFRSYFQLPDAFSIEMLENALLETDQEYDHTEREASVTSQDIPASTANRLPNFIIAVIKPLLSARRRSTINENNYQEFLQKLFPDIAKFNELNLLEKIKLLKRIEQTYIETMDEQFIAAKEKKSPGELRMNPLGTDYEGWTYWYFGGTRLYREIPLPQGSSKRSTEWMNVTDFSFDLICSTTEEWHNLIKKFQPSNRSSNKELASTLCDIGLKAISEFEAREAARQAKEAARLKREAKLEKAKKVELLPKKRSSRLEVKHEEEVKRQKLLEDEKQRAELEKYEYIKKIKEAKEQAEKDKRDLRIEEARLKNDIYAYISNLISQGQVELRGLRTMISSKASKKEVITKMQGWIGLLGDSISCRVTDENTIHFTSNNLQGASQSVVFRNAIRYYIKTIKECQLEPTSQAYEQLSSVYTKFILNRYENLDAFCSDLNHVYTTFLDTNELAHAIDLLKQIFASQLVNNAEKTGTEEHVDEKNNTLDVTPKDSPLSSDTTIHDTPIEANI